MVKPYVFREEIAAQMRPIVVINVIKEPFSVLGRGAQKLGRGLQSRLVPSQIHLIYI